MQKSNNKIPTVPVAVNFSELIIFVDNEPQQFDVGDDGRAVEEMESQIQAESLLLSVLNNLNDREKVIFLLQIARESGYALKHEDCAKSLSLTREYYMYLLSDVKKRAKKVVSDKRQGK